MALNRQEGQGGQTSQSNPSPGLWPLQSLQSRYTRSALDIAQELLPNLPQRPVLVSGMSSQPAQSAALPEGQVAVDMSSLVASEAGQGEPVNVNPQVDCLSGVF